MAFLLNFAHGYDPISNACKAFELFTESPADRELRELFNVAWHPAEVQNSMPINPELQSMPGGTYGNIFDILIDKPERSRILFSYPVVWAAGDVELGGKMLPVLGDYVKNGGTLVVNVNAAKGKLPASLLGVTFTDTRQTFSEWTPNGKTALACPPYEVEIVRPAKATKVLAYAAPGIPLITRTAIGNGAVILTLAPGMQGLDERAHPALPYLMNGITKDLLPIAVQLTDGSRPENVLMYQVNRTKNGWLVMLMNNQGVDKTQNGIARVDSRQYIDVVLRTGLTLKSAQEFTTPKTLTVEKDGQQHIIRLRVEAGDVQVVGLRVK